MNDPVEVVLLAGRLGLDDDGWPLAPLLDRLEQRGILPRVLCLSRGTASGQDPRFLELPALGNRWLRSFAIRRLRGRPASIEPACSMRSTTRWPSAALALADAWRLPYVQTVDDFAVLDRGLRLSRRWFRGLVATSRTWPTSWSVGCGFPPTGSA